MSNKMYVHLVVTLCLSMMLLTAGCEGSEDLPQGRLQISAAELVFPPLEIGEDSSQMMVELRNTGDAPVIVSSIVLTEADPVQEISVVDDDGLTSTAPSLQANQSRQIMVEWTPTDALVDEAEIVITHDAGLPITITIKSPEEQRDDADICGDNILDDDEECDDGNAITEECEYGVQSCTVCASDCTEQPGATRICGDNILDDEEDCDDGNAITEECEYGVQSCTVCAADCTELPGATRTCGDDVLDPEEACDDGNNVTEECEYGAESCTVCAADCTELPGATRTCGDDVLDPEEACDDGNNVTEECEYGAESCTVCAADCTEQPGATRTCGDDVLDPEEACDDGNTVTETCDYGVLSCIVCASDCTEQPGDADICGDNILDDEEECDDGNTVTEECEYGVQSCTICASDCTEQPGATRICGDNILDDEEDCDDGNAITEECEYGVQSCTVCASNCTEQPGATRTCGDDVLDPEEACDDGNTVTEACEYGVQSCTVCASDCTEQPGDADICGDNIIDDEETCDDGNNVTEECEYGVQSCTVCASNCTEQPGATRTCGDDVLDPEEECDDGNLVNDDGCSQQCTVVVGCQEDRFEGNDSTQTAVPTDRGDLPNLQICGGVDDWFTFDLCAGGTLQVEVFFTHNIANINAEIRTNGNLRAVGYSTTDNETLSVRNFTADFETEQIRIFSTSDNPYSLNLTVLGCPCGDGVVDDDEGCDDGNNDDGDGCSADCTLPNCGDGFVDEGEECDDGNDVETDDCLNTCRPTFCGDGIVQDDEQCDDGNDSNTDGCLNGCIFATCGDGVIRENVEQCDDGNRIGTDACTSNCLFARCGDGFVQQDVEECDDGNNVTETCQYNDPDCEICRADCTTTTGAARFCGDGVLDPEEVCDDGAENSDLRADACRTDCTAARCGDGVLDNGEACDDGNALFGDFCDACEETRWVAPLLILMIDFADTDTDASLPDSELRWSDMMFGTAQGEANHYWDEVFEGRFELEPAIEVAGNVNDGVIRIRLPYNSPEIGERPIVEQQPWLPDALDAAAEFIDFQSYDTDGDSLLDNRELSVFAVLNLSFSQQGGAGAQANITLNHPIAGTDVTLPRFARTLFRYSSIGVNVHELGHHIFSLKHFAPPGAHGVMSTGAYAEDPIVGDLIRPTYRWGTRPTQMISFSRLRAGSVNATEEVVGPNGKQLALHSIDSGGYNVISLPTADGYLLLENREAVGYDTSIPFCGQDAGGLFITEVAQLIAPLDVANIELRRDSSAYVEAFDICDRYSVSGHNDAFNYGGYRFSNVSVEGPTMTVDVELDDTPRALEALKFRWFKNDPDRVGYRLWWYERVTPLQPTVIDMADIPGGDNPAVPFGMILQGYYSTGETITVNHLATWSTTEPYLNITASPVTGGEGTTVPGTSVSVAFVQGVACPSDRRALVTAELFGEFYTAELINIPCHP